MVPVKMDCGGRSDQCAKYISHQHIKLSGVSVCYTYRIKDEKIDRDRSAITGVGLASSTTIHQPTAPAARERRQRTDGASGSPGEWRPDRDSDSVDRNEQEVRVDPEG